MRTTLLLIVFIISTFAFSANSNEDTTKIQIENLQKENESLKKEIEIIKAKSESTSVMIDNVDSMYQNNFDRMIFLFGFLGAIIVFAFPFWMQRTQKKLLKIKEEELNASNTKKINEVLKDFNEKLTKSEEKYIENLNKETENLHNTINEKTQELQQNIIEKTEYLKDYFLENNYLMRSKIFFLQRQHYKTIGNNKGYVITSLYQFENLYLSDKNKIINIYDKIRKLSEDCKDLDICIKEEYYEILLRLEKAYIKYCKDNHIIDIETFDEIKKVIQKEDLIIKKSEE